MIVLSEFSLSIDDQYFLPDQKVDRFFQLIRGEPPERLFDLHPIHRLKAECLQKLIIQCTSVDRL